MITLQESYIIAQEAHAGQKRKNGGDYFNEHCLPVSNEVLANSFGDEELAAAAVLHDTVEDTPVSFRFLVELGISARQMLVIVGVTRFPGKTYMEFVREMRRYGPDAVYVKIHDICNNLINVESVAPGLSDRYDRALKILVPTYYSIKRITDESILPAATLVYQSG